MVRPDGAGSIGAREVFGDVCHILQMGSTLSLCFLTMSSLLDWIRPSRTIAGRRAPALEEIPARPTTTPMQTPSQAVVSNSLSWDIWDCPRPSSRRCLSSHPDTAGQLSRFGPRLHSLTEAHPRLRGATSFKTPAHYLGNQDNSVCCVGRKFQFGGYCRGRCRFRPFARPPGEFSEDFCAACGLPISETIGSTAWCIAKAGRLRRSLP